METKRNDFIMWLETQWIAFCKFCDRFFTDSEKKKRNQLRIIYYLSAIMLAQIIIGYFLNF